MSTAGRVHIFIATDEFFPAVLDMVEAVHNESPILNTEVFSKERASQTIVSIMSLPTAFARIAMLNGEVIGCMAGIMAPTLTTDSLVASEVLLYVKPEHRGGRAALMLVRQFQKWAGSNTQRVGTSLGINDTGVVNFYKRLGYQPGGQSLFMLGKSHV